jgi:transcriptional regulator with XRE-family HTH domain
MKLRIKEILKEKKITAISLADSVGMAQPSMSNIVNGKVMPSIETLERIATILNVSFVDLFEQPIQNIITCPKCGTRLEVKEKK